MPRGVCGRLSVEAAGGDQMELSGSGGSRSIRMVRGWEAISRPIAASHRCGRVRDRAGGSNRCRRMPRTDDACPVIRSGTGLGVE